MVDPSDGVARAAQSQWALRELERALGAKGFGVQHCERVAQATGDLCVVAAGRDNSAAREMLKAAGIAVAAVPEALGIAPARANGKPVLVACGHDATGLVYALLDLADRVEYAADLISGLSLERAVAEQPANRIRSLTRLFTSDVEDKPWYNDREMWPQYLTMLATQRYNRFNLSLGIGYDFLRQVTDGYFLFAYPFLLAVPGYNVRVPQLPDSERDRNLQMLKFISEQTVARGLQFQLGIWMHGYEWINSPKPNYSIQGLTSETHGPYCRDALRMLLQACPAISGITFRIHGESGVEEGNYDLWKTIFDGRRGSGIAGDRCAYADRTLQPRWDWEKYAYSHRVWGRLLYNPASDPEPWRRYLRAQFGPGAAAAETSLASSSRILPLMTTSHGTSAGNNTYWPEVYLNQSMIDSEHYGPYSDTPAPRVFGNVSPLDPQLFSRINDFADALLKGEPGAKYSPVEAAQWIEDYAATAAKQLAQFEKRATDRDRPEYRRLAIDVALQIGLGRFFAAKFRSGVLYRIFEQTGDRAALEESLRLYRAARAAFAEVADRAKGVYVSDITVGENPQLRGHWLDRLPAMDADIAAIAAKLEQAKAGQPAARVQAAIREALGRPRQVTLSCRHTPPQHFRPGQPLVIEIWPEKPASAVRMYYRHVNHAERYQSAAMETRGNAYQNVIPGVCTDSAFPLQYYFEVSSGPDAVSLYPGLGAELMNQPYFVVRRA